MVRKKNIQFVASMIEYDCIEVMKVGNPHTRRVFKLDRSIQTDRQTQDWFNLLCPEGHEATIYYRDVIVPVELSSFIRGTFIHLDSYYVGKNRLKTNSINNLINYTENESKVLAESRAVLTMEAIC